MTNNLKTVVGQEVECPECGTRFIKTAKNHVYDKRACAKKAQNRNSRIHAEQYKALPSKAPSTTRSGPCLGRDCDKMLTNAWFCDPCYSKNKKTYDPVMNPKY